MKTLLILMATTILLPTQGLIAQEKYASTNGFVSFFSKAPVADVDAKNDKAKAELNTSNGEVTIEITMTDFDFENDKMGRDARKKYLEIDKYPKAGFKGKLQGKIDYDKPGTYNATATGKLKIHGVERDVTEKGTVTVANGGRIKLQSEFGVKLADHKIETPKILGQEMTEDNVQVKVEVTLTKSTKDVASKNPNK